MDIKNIKIEELVEGVNKCYKEGFTNIKEIAKELQKNEEKTVSSSYLSKRLQTEGYVYKDKHYIKVTNGENNDYTLEPNEYKYVATVRCTKQLANRVDADVYAKFNEMANKNFPGMNKSELLSLAIKNFIDRFNK